MKFESKNQEYQEIMGITEKSYSVPLFQRDYSWEEEHWEELWNDIQLIIDNQFTEFHYLGYLVFQEDKIDSNISYVIDGQQRLVTLSLLWLAAIDCLKEMNANDEQIQTINNFISSYNLIKQKRQAKLTLNQANNTFYQNHIVNALPIQFKLSNKDSNLKLKKGKEFFSAKLKTSFTTSQELITCLANLQKLLFFTVISVKDELNAYKVFETLNARGVQLSSADLIKNHLFKIAHEAGDSQLLEQMQTSWENFVSIVKDVETTDIIAYYWKTHSDKDITKKQLFKEISSYIRQDPTRAFEIVGQLEQVGAIYQSIRQNDETHFAKEDIQLRQRMEIKQDLPVLIASALKPLPDKERIDLVKWLNRANMRYCKLANKNPNAMEPIYHKLAREIMKGSISTLIEVKQYLKNSVLNVSKDSLITELCNYQFKKRQDEKLAKLLLKSLEEAKMPSLVIDIDNTKKLSLEHIMPKQEKEEICYLLGNLCFLGKKQNNQKPNLFKDNQQLFTQSPYYYTKTCLEDKSEWTEKDITKRTKEMARILENLFSLD